MRKLIPLVGILFFVASARAETWVKVASPHFTVISNGTEKDGREVATGFEQIRAVFALALPGLRTDSGAETIVVAARDEKTFADLLPFEKKRAASLAGAYQKHWEKDYVILRLDLPNQTRETIYHEYIHKLLHLNFTRLPVWLDEGLAEFYGNTQFRDNETIVGTPSTRISQLQVKTLLPLQTVLDVTPRSPYYHDEDKMQMFYAESWGLTHFLTFGPNMGNGQRMNTYLELLQKGVNAQDAFPQAFGNLDDLQKQFASYVDRFALVAARIKPVKIDSSTLTGGRMPEAEADAWLGGFFTYEHQLDTANERLTAAVTADPQNALAHENLGMLKFQQGQDADALKEFDQAAKLNPKSYLALYYQAMLKFQGKTDPDSLHELDSTLDKVIQLNPQFAPAFVVRSQIYVKLGRLQDAFNVAAQARKLEPDRAGFLTNAAVILLLGRNYPEAIKMADAVAGRWSTTDSAEALAVAAGARRLGNIQATPEEIAQETEEMKYSADTTAVQGVVKSVICDPSKPMQLVLHSDNADLNFEAGKPFGLGFSDTIWYGEDHFSACHHLEGMKAVVRYKPSAEPGGENQFRWLEIRNELIPSSVPQATEKPAASNELR